MAAQDHQLDISSLRTTMKTKPVPQKPMEPSLSARSLARYSLLATLGCALVATIYLFWPAISNPRITLWFSDGNMPQHRHIVEGARAFGGFFWQSLFFLGDGDRDGMRLYANWPLLAALPMGTSFWLNIAVHILWAAWGGWFCARRLGIGHYGSILSGVAFGLCTHFVSLISPGHLGKLQCIPWIPWAFGWFWSGWNSGRVRDFLLAAICFAPMWLSGEPQLAYYLGLYMGVLGVWQVAFPPLEGRATDRRSDPAEASPSRPSDVPADSPSESRLTYAGRRLGLSILCVALTVLLSWQGLSIFGGMARESNPGATDKSGHEDPAQAYEFATGWSFPPEETAVFLTTGRLFGIQSPLYWGRTGQGDLKLKQVDDYVGVLVLAFALLALLQVRKDRRAAFLLFILATSLLVAFGRFTPVYRLVYQLPTMASQRVPARWIAFTAFAFAMLAGIGLDRLIALLKQREPGSLRRVAYLPIGMAALAIVFIIWGGHLDGRLDGFAQSAFGLRGDWAASPDLATAHEKAALFVSALMRTSLMLALGAGLIALGFWVAARWHNKPGFDKAILAWTVSCAAFVAIDLAANNRNYINFFDWQTFYQPDPIVELFSHEQGLYRIEPIATQQHPYLQRFVSYVAPWNRLRLAEPAYSRTLPPLLEPLFTGLSKERNYRFNPRFYDLFAIKYVFSGVKLPENFATPAHLDLARTIPFGEQAPPLYLYQYHDFVAYPQFVPGSVSVADEKAALAAVLDPQTDLRKTVVGVGLPATPGNAKGQATLESEDNQNIRARVTSDGPGWVVIKEQYDTDWVATVDGMPQRVYRINYVHCGIPVQAGAHTITLTYRPSHANLNITVAGWLIVAAGFGGLVLFRRFGRRPSQP